MLGMDFVFQNKIGESKYLTVILLTIVLVFGSFFGIYSIAKSQENTLKADLRVKVAFLKDAIADRSKVNLLLNDTTGLAEISHEVQINSDNLINLSFFDAQKRPLWGSPQSANELFFPADASSHVEETDNTLMIAFEVYDNSNESLGYLNFLCSIQDINEDIYSLQLRIGIIALVLIFTLFLIAIWSTDRVSRINRARSLSEARFELIEKNNNQLAIENELLERILGQSDLYGIGSELVRKIAQFLTSDDAGLYAMVGSKLIQIASMRGKSTDQNLSAQPTTLTLGVGLYGRVAKSQKAILANDSTQSSDYALTQTTQGSGIAVPIILGDELIGVLGSEHADKGHYTQDHMAFLTKISSLTALGLKNSIIELEIKEKDSDLKELQKLREKLIKDLTESNDELRNYAHVVSHDLKTPLRSISAALTWLKEDNYGQLDDESYSYLSIVDDALAKMDKIISDTLKYSEVRNDALSLEQVDLTSTLDNLMRELGQSYPDTSIEVCSSMPILLMNETKLIQVFQNILDNACKYRAPNKRSKVTIKCAVIPDFFEFVIEDNGIGIPEESAHHVFEIFQKLNNDKDGSNGIGLSIVKKIIETHGGKIWFDSKQGQGTTFKFILPRSLEGKTPNIQS